MQVEKAASPSKLGLTFVRKCDGIHYPRMIEVWVVLLLRDVGQFGGIVHTSRKVPEEVETQSEIDNDGMIIVCIALIHLLL